MATKGKARARPGERLRGQGYSLREWQIQAVRDMARADGVRPSWLVRAAVEAFLSSRGISAPSQS